ncbi:photosystem II D1 precursor processing protein PSB27-H2, chloroplastic isoform X1 [Camellia sinensis]|uniref:photosystem II D1 precursor processing protein PSB27-H2, chloroplastic isoform X1 n=1 Tax=Camellia sinensis TaxID=4442 RepID=UPI001036A266|nr:photosystem II D1 precursor processing protein PSB27-H2, chloroplastic isoform X1 [Camellia sinensis]
MAVSLVSVKRLCPSISSSAEEVSKPVNQCNVGFFPLQYKLRSRCHVVLPSQETVSHRRHVLLCGSVSIFTTLTFNCPLMPLSAWAGDEVKGEEENKDENVVGAIKSLFDPDEKTKTGKVLPKAYLKSAREVVKTLRESLKEDPKDVPKFRRTADSAKESIREYLNGWRGQKTVVNEESYVVLEKAIRSLASFYSKAGPSAPLPEEVKSEILNDLNTAEEFL